MITEVIEVGCAKLNLFVTTAHKTSKACGQSITVFINAVAVLVVVYI